MVALIAFALATAAVPRGGALEPASTADLVGRWDPLIREAAGRAAIPEAWIRRVIRAESAGRTSLGGQPITSRAGAMGLMQLMPATWSAMRAKLGLRADPFDPHDNIVAGAAFLRLMYDRFGYPGLFGAYNAGPARYAAYLHGRALPAETVGYLTKVAGGDARSEAGTRPVESAARPSLFVPVGAAAPSPSRAPEPAAALFAVRHGMDSATAGSPASAGGE